MPCLSARRARRSSRRIRLAAAAALASAALALLACAAEAPKAGPALGLRLTTPGRLLVVFERAGGRRELVLLEQGGVRRVEMPAFHEVRFVRRELLVAVLDATSVPKEPGAPIPTQLALHDLATGETKRFGPIGQQYDPEPSPDGRFLAVGVERPAVGEAEFEIWSLEGDVEQIASRPQALEEPRWREDGRAIAVAILQEDPEGDSETGGGFGGRSLVWPRLYWLRRDLGSAERIDDGAQPGQLAPGGSLPLWWDARGLYARQREGLVRCDVMQGGCTRAYAPEPGRRVVDGRPVGAREAWLLTVEATDAFDRREPDEIVRVDLDTGAVLSRWHAPPGVSVIDIDWIE
ncbi:MAG TPA: hypothetical protein VMW19_03105 [Myxococcota bacterium]|nr:hypothetical protein [Myxococcota bacterium]